VYYQRLYLQHVLRQLELHNLSIKSAIYANILQYYYPAFLNIHLLKQFSKYHSITVRQFLTTNTVCTIQQIFKNISIVVSSSIASCSMFYFETEHIQTLQIILETSLVYVYFGILFLTI